jgi:hypothetical protein
MGAERRANEDTGSMRSGSPGLGPKAQMMNLPQRRAQISLRVKHVLPNLPQFFS